MYFATLLATLFLAAFPVIFGKASGAACTSRFCFLSGVIDAGGSFLPGFAGPWIAAFKVNAGWFALGAVLLAFFIAFGITLEFWIGSRMRDIWLRTISTTGDMRFRQTPPTDPLYQFRTSDWYRGFWLWMKRKTLPAIFAVLALLVGLTIISRALFTIESSAGFICRDDTPSGQSDFDTRQSCWRSPFDLEAGYRYRITMTVTEPWIDGSIPTGLEGFDVGDAQYLHQRVALAFAMLARRAIGEPWYRPIARIGPTGSDEYPLEPEDHLGGRQTMTVVIKARSTGKLYLFVNDAVVGFYPITDLFYWNNQGKAKITVERMS